MHHWFKSKKSAAFSIPSKSSVRGILARPLPVAVALALTMFSASADATVGKARPTYVTVSKSYLETTFTSSGRNPSARPIMHKVTGLAAKPSIAGTGLGLGKCSGACSVDRKAAVEFAIAQWNLYVGSPRPLKVDVEFISLSDGVAGENVPQTGFYGVGGNSEARTVYPPALAETIENEDLNEDRVDIMIRLNDISYYEAIDGGGENGKPDLVTAVMHELGHGLGIESSLKTSASGLEWGYRDEVTDTPLASVYDTHLHREHHASLFAVGQSTILLSATERLVFNSMDWMSVLLGSRPPFVFYQAKWQPGTSLSHLEFSDLMAPSLGSAAQHEPEQALVEVLRSLGWPTEPIFQPGALTLSCANGKATVTFTPASPPADGHLILRTSTPRQPLQVQDGAPIPVGARIGSWEVRALSSDGKFEDGIKDCTRGTTYAVVAYNGKRAWMNVCATAAPVASLP